ncbi:flagellar basal-body rod protein FlgG [Candidatus Fukatsuia endosymbiont of Tuberolachnus salignus]|uniref:flagellar basal-body rod protein FlgG n=1 Tax=Candidatus Fukatsuia endosymbiont of Tuberolachnus salignus TaxID=3077957 RepID=UPI00313E079C
MSHATWVSKTGLLAQDAKMKAIANNLANVNTDSFKRDDVIFADLFYQTQRLPGSPVDQNNISPNGIQFGGGVRVVGTQKKFTIGTQKESPNEMHVAITGQGFFQVEMTDGNMAYTRAGNLSKNADGVLTTTEGFPLNPRIELPEGLERLIISENGAVNAMVGGEADPVELGQLTLVNFVNPAGLLPIGNNLYRETTASGEAQEGEPGEGALGKLMQNALEGSNVQVVEEMVEMLAVQQAWEIIAKSITAGNEMDKYVTHNI